jgi:DNA-binding MarR family transcriptional regulator
LSNLSGLLFRRMARVHNRALKRHEVSAVQAGILVTLWLEGPITIGELQAQMALSSATATGAIDRMERAGLLRRVRKSEDRRAIVLEPADWPRARKLAVAETLARSDDECFAALTAAERRELTRLLKKTLGGMAEVDLGDDE